MPSITAVLHTENDALRLGRALETLYPCDDIVVIDHGSRDATVRIARQYGARLVHATATLSPQDCLQFANPEGWILSLDPCESLTEKLAASLFEWKSSSLPSVSSRSAFSVFLREETAQGWLEVPVAQTRLVPHKWKLWNGKHPVHDPSARHFGGRIVALYFSVSTPLISGYDMISLRHASPPKEPVFRVRTRWHKRILVNVLVAPCPFGQ